MDVTVVVQLKSPTSVQPIDNKLCIIKKPANVRRIIDTCKQQEEHGTNKYVELNQRIHMTEKTSVEATSYHVTCYRQFTTNDIYIKRAITRLSKSDNNDTTSSSSFLASVPKSRRLSRSAVPTYDPEKCIFCQTTLNERLHECMQDSRDEELKQALADCPQTLGIFRVRFERACVARAGDKVSQQLLDIKHLYRLLWMYQSL